MKKFLALILFCELIAVSSSGFAQDTLIRKIPVRVQQLMNLYANDSLPSTSKGTVSEGSLVNGKLMPYCGKNFFYFDTTSYLAKRAFVHGDVRSAVLDAYHQLALKYPGRQFGLMECSNEHGGKIFPHHTHQNGLSIDFMSPLIQNNLPYYGLDTLGANHYWLEFNDDGTYEKDKTISLDFDLIAQHILLLESKARVYGMKISKVIFKLELKDELFASPAGAKLSQSGIYFAQKLTDQINDLHDDHYHIDFVFL